MDRNNPNAISTRTAELRANFHVAATRYAACQKQLDEIGSESTMIVEPSVGIPMGNSVAGRVISALTAQERVRWMIPFKVTPFVYGDPGGTKYFYMDRAGVAHGGGTPIRVNQLTRRALSTFNERRAWLDQHPELKNATRHQIIKALKSAGMIAPTTFHGDVRIYRETGPDLPVEELKS